MLAAVIGAGAVGAIYAEMLTKRYGKEQIGIIVDEERRKRYEEDSPIFLNGKQFQGNFVSAPHAGSKKEPASHAAHERSSEERSSDESSPELIIIAVKGYHLDQAVRDIDPFVGKRTQIISLINGIASEQALIETFGSDHVIPALTAGQDSVKQGSRISYTKCGKIVIGEYPDGTYGNRSSRSSESVSALPQRVQSVHRLLSDAGIPCEIAADIKKEQWWKLMVNAGINQVSAVRRLPYGAFQQEGAARSEMLAAMHEVYHAARAEGIGLEASDIQSWLDLLSTLSPEGKTSMLQDVENGRPTEAELFAGTVIPIAERHHIDVPVNRKLYAALKKNLARK